MASLDEAHQKRGEILASALMAVGGVTLSPKQPFVWRSGIHSPIYVDARRLISQPVWRKQLKESAVKMIQDVYGERRDDKRLGIAAVATGGLPWGSLLADALDVPLIYVRSSKKTYGKEQAVEGEIDPSRQYLVVEDVISTGGSAISAAKALREAGGQTSAVFALYTYELPQARSQFQEASLTLWTLGTFFTLIDAMYKNKACAPETYAFLLSWHRSLQGTQA